MIGIGDVRFDDLDLAHLAHGHEVVAEIGAAHAHADAIACFRQRLDGVAAQKARAAEDCDQRRFHDALP